MTSSPTLADKLRAQRPLYQRLLQLVEQEHHSLHQPDSRPHFQFQQLRQELLPALERALGELKRARSDWLALPVHERQEQPQTAALLQSTQDLIMKTILLDRENEQTLLRRGLIPASQFPSAHQQHPHFVADLYRRHCSP